MALNALAEINRQGKGVLCVEGALSALGVLAISTGLATIDSVAVSVKKATAPTTISTTWEFSNGVVTVYGWKVTDTDDTALIASDAEETVSVTIIGRRRQ